MSLLELVVAIFTYNLLTFGNGPAMIPMLQKNLVDEHKILTTSQLLYAFAIARITPGQANVYVAAVGFFLYGLLGAVLTTLAIQLPGYLMLLLLRGYEYLQGATWVNNFTRGLTITSVGLIFAATVGIGQRSLTNSITWIVFVFTLALIYLFKRDPLISMGIASLLGILLKFLNPG